MLRRTLTVPVVIVAVALIALFGGVDIWSDFMWFTSLGYENVFWTTVLARFTIGLLTFVPLFLFFWFNFWYVRRYLPRQRVRHMRGNVIEMGHDPAQAFLMSRLGTWVLLAISAVPALLLSIQAATQWEMVLRFIHATPFGWLDPVFGRDAGFYVFGLPFYELLYSLLNTTFITGLILSGLAYYLLASREFLEGGWRVFSPVKIHLALLVAGLLSIKAWDYYLSSYRFLLSQGEAVFGAGYTDLHARLPALKVLMVLALLVAVVAFAGILWGRLKPIGIGIGILVAASIILGVLFPFVVQKFQVEPNEYSREQPYLEHNMAATRFAYGLDKVRQEDFMPGPGALERAVIEENQEALANLRIWDYRALGQVYNQLQQLRPYYSFADVDVDRYQIDGSYRQIMLSVRELDQDNLSEQARTWVNRRLQYTHGYGVVASPVNEVTIRGLPVFLVKDIPPKSSVGELEIVRPEIYFGELTKNVVVVNTRAGEFDYPSGQTNVYANYQGTGGVPLTTWGRRLGYALRFHDLRLLFSGDITPESRILYHRTVQDARRLAPYLTYDKDPYPVIAGGRIYWIWDAYTTTDHYPYSQPTGNMNYIRNAVKVVLDAYEGSIRFFVSDPEDPIIQTYSRIFPGLYRPLDELPRELRPHLRYPQDLFQVQASVYTVYHMRDSRVFYNREDEWAVPSKKQAETTKPMEPYYTIMRLPGEDRAEFVLVLPFTPVNRENLVAWMAARSDGQRYGELVVYKSPKDAHLFGPNQVEASIDQDAVISQQLTLWNQRGSQVLRGNLITVPLAGGLLYVEPLFLQAEQNSLPELIRVIAFYEGRVVMDRDLKAVLKRLFTLEAVPADESRQQETGETGLAEEESSDKLALRANELYQEALESLRSGDWANYGKAIDELGEVLNRMLVR